MYIITNEKILKKNKYNTILVGFYTTNNIDYYIYYTDKEDAYNYFIKKNKHLYFDINSVINYLLKYKGETIND